MKAAIQQHLRILDDQIWHGIYLSCPCQRIYRLMDEEGGEDTGLLHYAGVGVREDQGEGSQGGAMKTSI
jgi:hypothetical protein